MSERKIVPIGVDASYLEARRLVKERGGKLPSNVLHDRYVVRSSDWVKIEGYHPAWARELLVHPARGGEFKKGFDIVDSRTRWVLPASYIPENAFERKGVGLFIDPEEVTQERGKIIIHAPGNVIVLSPFAEGLLWGPIDRQTRLPLGPEARDSPLGSGRIYTTDGVGVRPFYRDRTRDPGYCQYTLYASEVFASYSPNLRLGVGLER